MNRYDITEEEAEAALKATLVRHPLARYAYAIGPEDALFPTSYWPAVTVACVAGGLDPEEVEWEVAADNTDAGKTANEFGLTAFFPADSQVHSDFIDALVLLRYLCSMENIDYMKDILGNPEGVARLKEILERAVEKGLGD